MAPRVFGVSAIALGAVALALSSPLSAASAASVAHRPSHGVHRHVAHAYGVAQYVHHYARGYPRRYAYGNGYG